MTRLKSRGWQPQRGNLAKYWTVVGPGDFAGIAYDLLYVITEVFLCPPDRIIRVELNIE